MKYIGPHVSISGGLSNAPLNAAEYGASGFAMFTKNQRQWFAPEITDEDSEAFRETCRRCGFSPAQILPHDTYLINLGQPDAEKRAHSVKAFAGELERCRRLGLTMLNFHPGSHLREIGEAECIRLIAESVRTALDEVDGVCAVFENVAGQGSNLGYTFEQLADMLEAVDRPERVGVCIDTCHAFAAGFPLDTEEGFEQTFADFERIIGFSHLKAMHLNDAKGIRGQRLDRHAPLGEGNIGWGAFERIAGDPRFEGIPLVLETPEPEKWADEIRRLRQIAEA
jgi:deoxyribonuclease-4